MSLMGLVCLSFDVEEWDSPVVFGVESEYSMSDEFSAKGCHVLMELLKKYDVKANFFITGVFAKNYPDIVRKLVERGHEIGCHGNVHKDLKRLGPEELRKEISTGLELVQKAAGINVKGFRSPRNSINPRLYDVLSELSFEYDSSVHPAMLPGRYSDVFKKKDVHTVDGSVEVPMSTLCGLPISWWWMRNIGVAYTVFGCGISAKLYGYSLLYFHPWEFTALPEVKGLPKHITKGTGEKALRDLESLIIAAKRRGHVFGTIRDIIEIKRGQF
jgi:peptidoglycan/xylan/chitin deacetylase (PgdA/CDA1 family)